MRGWTKGGIFYFDMKFLYKKNIYNALQFFFLIFILIFFFFFFFLKYKISAPFSLVEAKTLIFNIHLG